MVIVMRLSASQEEIAAVNDELKRYGLEGHLIQGVNRFVIGAVGDRRDLVAQGLEVLPGVEKIVPIMRPFKLVSREAQEEPTVVRVKDVAIGGREIVLAAGPCAVESREQIYDAAVRVKAAGAKILRGGAYKPRTSPYSFQGLEEEGLKILAGAGEETGLATVSEVVDLPSLDVARGYVDMLQIGARNMQNFRLLQAAGRSGKPILLKRGLSATIEEWLMAAEYIMSEGNSQVVLCERGIRTFETATRNTLDLNAVPVVKELSHLPILIDPSHATGVARWVGPMSRAAIAAGADGLLVEVHPEPSKALSDGPQSLTPMAFTRLAQEVKRVAESVGRSLQDVKTPDQSRYTFAG
ncbi:3-deoxy-8-phosphooctulonate synthase/3-deoxy-7-phosphoheptulonate synthase [Acididesulfobacillus acetoxydans]|uniref:3-deoxy-8-phosphooctulonate synthase/3-deoxy-7-phosphoheptulonate synthase n=1 Tax=Acididesulfobacillus acetoxydans TaxID=1561005 RepID=A0A8S0X1Z1_9FIRM|nr:3-deoxy-7-phosphoheptulonate synthase [Acididesulfobacillus acetoxydans]CAA7603341.1 3-deoxy-8-phosphooctulonate synthase/3-deoxy-7-phosphoheptulonate synthase [Acididesulfobacillus acetoxydans]CEJ08658.1 Phospho-2-dehydro-3-deoxyheptonate aldolase [Acididesulfobacillus acetoxydans]